MLAMRQATPPMTWVKRSVRPRINRGRARRRRGRSEAGAAVFAEQGCSGCHAVEEGVEGMTGPPAQYRDGRQRAHRTERSRIHPRSITNPSAHVVEGYENVMPPYELPDDQLDNLVAYLMTLTGE